MSRQGLELSAGDAAGGRSYTTDVGQFVPRDVTGAFQVCSDVEPAHPGIFDVIQIIRGPCPVPRSLSSSPMARVLRGLGGMCINS